MRGRMHAARVALAIAVALVAAASAGAAGGRAHARQQRPPAFRVSVAVAAPLWPGRVQRLDLRVRNPHRFALRVTRLKVSLRVDTAHDHAGCDRQTNFHVVGLSDSTFPLRVPPRSTRSLRQLGVASLSLPTLVLRARPVNQDACKGARLTLRFTGRATRWRAR